MKTKNICKFITENGDGSLQTARFILETELPEGSQSFIADTHRVYLISEGEGCITCSGKTQTLSRGSMVFVVAGMTYALCNTNHLRYMYLDFSGKRGDSLLLRFHITENSNVFHGMTRLLPIWKESLVNANGDNIDLLSESMLLLAFSQLSDAHPVPDAGTALTDYLNEHFQDHALTLTTVAEALGYNAKYLSRMFAEKMGVGFSDYLRELRLRQAVLLMRQGLTSVKNISILCGFADPLYFSKVFKQKFGLSPKAYIAQQNSTEKP